MRRNLEKFVILGTVVLAFWLGTNVELNQSLENAKVLSKVGDGVEPTVSKHSGSKNREFLYRELATINQNPTFSDTDNTVRPSFVEQNETLHANPYLQERNSLYSENEKTYRKNREVRLKSYISETTLLPSEILAENSMDTQQPKTTNYKNEARSDPYNYLFETDTYWVAVKETGPVRRQEYLERVTR